MGDTSIQVFLSDDETALKTSLEVIWPGVPQLLCVWHVNKNVEEAIAGRWIRRPENYDSLTPEEQRKHNEKNKERRKEFPADWQTVATIANAIIS